MGRKSFILQAVTHARERESSRAPVRQYRDSDSESHSHVWYVVAIGIAVAVLAGAGGMLLITRGRANAKIDRITPIAGQRVQVAVTTGGGEKLVVNHSLHFSTGMTALAALRDVTDVRTDSHGHVLQVAGMGGGIATAFGPLQAQWTYRVNGIEPNVPASAFQLRPGMSLWWDLRRTDIYASIPVAIGVFPEPLLDGYRDDVRPVRITYGKGFGADAAEFAKLFDRINPYVKPLQEPQGLSLHHTPAKLNLQPITAVRPDRANLIIGRWEDIEQDPYLADIATHPRTFGLTTWIEGHDIYTEAPDSDVQKPLPDAEGLVWATTLDGQPDSPIVFVVTGVTDRGVRAAAHALRSGALQYYLSAAVDADGNVL